MLSALATSAIAALLLVGVAPLAAEAVATGSITGVVSGPLTPGAPAVPLGGASASIFTVDGGIIPGSDAFDSYGLSGPDGTYTITGIPAGTYAMSAFVYGYKEQLLGGGSTFATSTKVTVTSGGQTSGINFAMALNVDSITGRVTGKSTTGGADVALAYTSVTAYHIDPATESFQPVAGGVTDADGHYSIQNLPTGIYYLQFYSPDSEHLGTWYQRTLAIPNGSTISVTDGVLVAGIDQVLELAGPPGMGGISGTITGVTQSGAPSVPVSGATVQLYADDLTFKASITTDAAGAYSITGIPTGFYKVHVTDVGSYFGEWWSDHPTAADAGTITFGPGQIASGTDLELSQLANDHAILVDDFLPAIEGTPTVGSTLTAWTAGWRPEAATTSLQWVRNGIPIAGATAATYIVAATDVGASITVEATGSRAGYRPTTVSSPAVVVSGATLISVKPIITGTPRVGQRLFATAGTWGPAPVKLTYQWKSNGVPISGAIYSTYLVGSTQGGKKISVSVVGKKVGYTSVLRTSSSSAAVAAGILSGAVPKISGTVKVGQNLTAVAGTWGPGSVTLSYQWTADGVAIPGATASTFTLTSAQLGKKIVVKVTGKKTGYTTLTKSSGASVAVVK